MNSRGQSLAPRGVLQNDSMLLTSATFGALLLLFDEVFDYTNNNYSGDISGVLNSYLGPYQPGDEVALEYNDNNAKAVTYSKDSYGHTIKDVVYEFYVVPQKPVIKQ